MRVSIGIFAFNECDGIAKMLSDLFTQDLIVESDRHCTDVEIICVANGCTDSTATVAKQALEREAQLLPEACRITWQVIELSTPGKSNAWNHFVHAASSRDVDYLVCLDADIALPQAQCLSGVIACLASNLNAIVAVDRPVKDIEIDRASGPLSRLNRMVTKSKRRATTQGKYALCGQLYCGRAKQLRSIWLPARHLLVDDGFIKAMVITRCFTEPEDFGRLVSADECFHVFEAYNTPAALLHHNRRLLLGIMVNAVLYEYLWQNATPEKPAGQIIKEKNEENPEWVLDMTRSSLNRKRRWNHFSQYVMAPLRQCWRERSLRAAPAAIVQCVFRSAVVLTAERHLRSMRLEW